MRKIISLFSINSYDLSEMILDLDLNAHAGKMLSMSFHFVFEEIICFPESDPVQIIIGTVIHLLRW